MLATKLLEELQSANPAAAAKVQALLSRDIPAAKRRASARKPRVDSTSTVVLEQYEAGSSWREPGRYIAEAVLLLQWTVRLSSTPETPRHTRYHLDVALLEHIPLGKQTPASRFRLAAVLAMALLQPLNALEHAILNPTDEDGEFLEDDDDEEEVPEAWPVWLTLAVPAHLEPVASLVVDTLADTYLRTREQFSELLELTIVGSTIEVFDNEEASSRTMSRARAAPSAVAPAQRLVILEQVATELLFDKAHARLLSAGDEALRRSFVRGTGRSPREFCEAFGLLWRHTRRAAGGTGLDPGHDRAIEYLQERAGIDYHKAASWIEDARMLARVLDASADSPVVRVVADVASSVGHAQLMPLPTDQWESWDQLLETLTTQRGRALPAFTPRELLVPRNLAARYPAIGQWCEQREVRLVHPASGFASKVHLAREVRQALRDVLADGGHAELDALNAFLERWAFAMVYRSRFGPWEHGYLTTLPWEFSQLTTASWKASLLYEALDLELPGAPVLEGDGLEGITTSSRAVRPWF